VRVGMLNFVARESRMSGTVRNREGGMECGK